MSLTDPNSFAPDLPQRGGGRVVDGKLSEAGPQAAERIAVGPSWGPGATVTYGFRTSGTPPEGGVFSPFTTAQIRAADNALLAWSDIANISFRRTEGDQATILFGNFSEGELAGYAYSPGDAGPGAFSGDVWINAADPDLIAAEPNYFGAHVILHEIGHALGLDHPSNYDNGALDDISYETLAAYYEDTIQYTVMSYFFEFNTNGDYGDQYPSAPMPDDVAALQRLYGANMATRAGDTVYGFNSNAGRDWLSATTPSSRVMFAAWDAGGDDTFDFSGFSGRQLIDLRQGAFSDVLGFTGNVSVAPGAVIENARGGTGEDRLTGNGANNVLNGGDGEQTDRLYGEGGDDTLFGGPGGDYLDGGSGNNLIDGGAGGDILLLAGSFSDYITTEADGLLRVSGRGNTHLLRDVEFFQVGMSGRRTYSMAEFLNETGGPATPPIRYAIDGDFSNDGRADLLWRNADGGVSTWLLGENATSARTNAFYAQVAPDWRIVETFNWNGDRHADILWRRADSSLAIWNGTANGLEQGSFYAGPVGQEWSIAATGDLNADGRDDLVWRHRDGAVSTWRSSTFDFERNSFYFAGVGPDWKIVDTGDFDGDGRADLLWRNDNGAISIWRSTGANFAQNSFFDGSVGLDWHIDGVADLNGDRRDDLIWRAGNGAISTWRSNGAGFDKNVFFDGSVPSSWAVGEAADFSGDGRADILWRNDNGAISVWRSTGDGFDQNVFSDDQAGTAWNVAGHIFPL